MLESPNARMPECPNALTPREAARRTGHAVPHRRNARLRKVHGRAQGEGRRSYGRDPRVLGNALKGLTSRDGVGDPSREEESDKSRNRLRSGIIGNARRLRLLARLREKGPDAQSPRCPDAVVGRSLPR